MEDRLAGAVLFALGLLILLVAFDRHETRAALLRLADVECLESASDVLQELEQLVRQATSDVDALGARSRSSGYLDAIAAAVTAERVIYHRTFDRDHIPHGLHQHLSSLIGNRERVLISWVPEEKYGNITVTGEGCVIALPAAVEAEMQGLPIRNPEGSRSYLQYVRSVWEKGDRVLTQDELRALCDSCSPGTAGDANAIRAIIRARSGT